MKLELSRFAVELFDDVTERRDRVPKHLSALVELLAQSLDEAQAFGVERRPRRLELRGSLETSPQRLGLAGQASVLGLERDELFERAVRLQHAHELGSPSVERRASFFTLTDSLRGGRGFACEIAASISNHRFVEREHVLVPPADRIREDDTGFLVSAESAVGAGGTSACIACSSSWR